MTNDLKYEAVKFSSFEHNGETINKRHFVANVRQLDNGGFDFHVPDGFSIQGRVVIQPKQERSETEAAAA